MSAASTSCRASALPSCTAGASLRSRSSRPAAALRRRQLVAVRAQEGSGAPPPQQQEQQAADERRLEALEAAAKARKGVKAEQADAFRGTARPARASSSGGPGSAEWKEGQLFPEGWEEMDPLQKATELYMGKRGFMYWATESAKYSVGILLVGWALFRFVGPALGLYTLTNDLSNPNFL